MNYYFKIITSRYILLDDSKKEEHDREKLKEITIFLKEEDADKIIDQMMIIIHDLPLYERIKDAPKIRKLINKLLYNNGNKEKPAEPISKEETEELMKLLINLENISFCIYLLDKLRGKKAQLKEYEFNIMSDIFKKIATFFWDNRAPRLFSNLMMLSSSYYLKKENGKKIYIDDNIKDYELFKNIALWKYILNYQFSKVKNQKNLYDDDKIQKAVNLSNDAIISFTTEIGAVFRSSYIYGIPEESFKILINNVINKFPKNTKEQLRNIIFKEFEDWKKRL